MTTDVVVPAPRRPVSGRPRPAGRPRPTGRPLSTATAPPPLRTTGNDLSLPDLPRWPLAMAFAGYPVWWLLGFAWLVWPITAVVMLVVLAQHRALRMPPALFIWLLLLYGTIMSVFPASSHTQVIGWGSHSAGYFAAAVLFVYIYNMRSGVRAMARYCLWFWGVAIVGGLAGTIAPTFSYPTIGQKLLNLGGTTTTVRFGSISALGTPRPAAPFVYANKWGAIVAITTPVVVAVIYRYRNRSPAARWLIVAGLAVSIIPIIYSLNRTLWVSLAFGLFYIGVRSVRRGRIAVLFGLIAAVIIGFLVLYVSSLSTVASAKLGSSSSTDARLTIYSYTLQGFVQSPWIGHVTTGNSVYIGGQTLRAVLGTQGQFWTLLYAGGLLSVVPYYAFMLYSLWRTRHVASPLGTAFRIGLIVSLAASFVYSLIPDATVLMLGCFAAMYRMQEAKDARDAAARASAAARALAASRRPAAVATRALVTSP